MPILPYEWTCFYLLPVVAFLFRAVSHAGAVGYLVLMALFGFARETIIAMVLVSNVILSLIAFGQRVGSTRIHWKMMAHQITASVPFAYLSVQYKLDT